APAQPEVRAAYDKAAAVVAGTQG
ncbi:MAG: hypothetical protein Q605_AUC00089G0002, partial [Actinomyces urogenitalis DORA_12]